MSKPASFLLRVQPADAVAPSLLFGTFHSDDDAVITTWSPVLALLATARPRRLIHERDLNEPGLAALQTLPDGATLRAALADRPWLYRATRAAARTRRLPEQMLERLRPWFVGALLMQAPARRGGQIIDALLADTATALGIETLALERFADIVGYYETGFSREQRLALLAETVCNRARLDQAVAAQTAAYAANDPARLLAAMSGYDSADATLSATLNRVFVSERNRALWPRLLAELRRGDSFIALGSLHIFGHGGVLERLREDYPDARIEALDPRRLAPPQPAARWPQVLAWLRRGRHGAVPRGAADARADAVTVEGRALPALRRLLCPGRRCEIETSYLPATRRVLVAMPLYARLLAGDVYADSLLLRELARDRLYRQRAPRWRQRLGALSADAAEACIRRAALHHAARAQFAYLRERAPALATRTRSFAQDPRCPRLD